MNTASKQNVCRVRQPLFRPLSIRAFLVTGFCFEGFLPQKKGRIKRLTALTEESRTLIFYESPYRLIKALEQMGEIFGTNRMACVAREISKKFEEFKRGTFTELIEYFTEKGVKGEIVILVEGKKRHDDEDVEEE